jgi:hypothetical protein
MGRTRDRQLGFLLLSLALGGCGGEDLTTPRTTGTLQLVTATTGVEIDPDGYTVRLDGEPPRAIGASASLPDLEVAAGSHTVQLAGLAPNCAVTGENPRTVSLPGDQTRKVSFDVTCTATIGTLYVTTATSGDNLDADGYTVAVDGGDHGHIDASAAVTLGDIAPGAHTVSLGGVASNCLVEGNDPVDVTIQPGATAQVAFQINCHAPGAISWSTIPLPVDFVARSIWASSPSDIFVTGFYQSATLESLVLHYDGSAWTEQLRGDWTRYTFVWGITASNVFVVGAGTARHYDGRSWADIGPGDDNVVFLSVWGNSKHDVYAGGWYEAIPEGGQVRHYGGASWTRLPSGGLPGSYGHVTDMQGISSTNIYALGHESSYDAPPEEEIKRSMVLHYNGSTWERSFVVTYQYANPAGAYDLNAIWVNGSDDIFVVGEDGHIVHSDGASWQQMPSSTTGNILDVWGASRSNVYAVGTTGILHYDGTSWSVINPTPGKYIWGTPQDVFVVTEGEILHGH